MTLCQKVPSIIISMALLARSDISSDQAPFSQHALNETAVVTLEQKRKRYPSFVIQAVMHRSYLFGQT